MCYLRAYFKDQTEKFISQNETIIIILTINISHLKAKPSKRL